MKAITVYGRSTIIHDEDLKGEIIEKLVKKHPRLVNLASMDKVTVIQVGVKSIFYLEGVNDADYITVKEIGARCQLHPFL